MKITITAVPKALTSIFINEEKIASDDTVLDYAQRMKEFIFGKETLKACALMDMDIFNLVFIKGTPFREYVMKKVQYIDYSKMENTITALLINAMYRGKPIYIMSVVKSGEKMIIGELTAARLSIIDTSFDYNRKNKWLLKRYERNSEKEYEMNKISQRYLETIQMAVVKYYMRCAINEKEFMEKINHRRFSTGLRLNNRPAPIEEINALLMKRRNMTFIDLTDSKSRVTLSALYGVVYKNMKLSEIMDSDKVFSANSDNEEKYSAAASEFINIIYNGNGIEISDILVKMAEKISKVEIPVINPGKLNDIIDNFSVIYSVAAIAYKFDKAFTEHEMLKKNMRRMMIDNYWNVYCNIIQYKKFGSVVAFAYLLANLDLNKYRDDISYSDEIMNEFAEAEKAIKEINKEVYGL